MPGPLLKLPKFDVANAASKLPEPARKPAGMALQALMDLAGADDPGSVMQPNPMAAPAAPLVSLYKNVADRKWATDATLEAAKRLYPESIHDQVTKLIQRLPRVSAHMKLSPAMTLGATGGVTEWSKRIPNIELGLSGARIPVRLNKGVAEVAASPDILAHEMTHVAQLLGNKNTPELYDLATRGLMEHPVITHGEAPSRIAEQAYLENPFERNARLTALRKTRGVETIPVPVGEQIATWAEIQPDNPHFQNAVRIMKARAAGNPPAQPSRLPFKVPESRATRPAGGDNPAIRALEELGDVSQPVSAGPLVDKPRLQIKQLSGHRSNITTRKANKMDPDKVRQLKSESRAGASVQELAQRYGINYNTTRQILKGDSWGWVK